MYIAFTIKIYFIWKDTNLLLLYENTPKSPISCINAWSIVIFAYGSWFKIYINCVKLFTEFEGNNLYVWLTKYFQDAQYNIEN